MKILYVEDEPHLADAVIHVLSRSGITADWVADGESALDLATKPIYDAIVLDIMLPKLSGWDVLSALRRRGIKTPVIMLSALSEVEDKVRALDLGADDYLAKPFKTAELVARLNALTRRPALRSNPELRYHDLTLNLADHTLNDFPLTEKEFGIMEALLQNPDTIHQKSNLLARVWGSDAVGEGNYVEVYVSNLRKKLANLSSKCYIKTIRNLGYKLCSKN